MHAVRYLGASDALKKQGIFSLASSMPCVNRVLIYRYSSKSLRRLIGV